uniref:Large ribosomal subunit protein uL13m n=1 Tax=Mastacembelus armatus TaxID=205130 RepID=A0A3Q3NHQ9_9TELE
MSSFSRSAQQWATFARSWFLIDARMQPPGKIATMCSVRLQGKHKPIYHALSDCGDHVVVINTKHIAFSGNKWEQKVYSSHTGYPGGFKQLTAAQLHQKDPRAIVKLAVYGMLPKNLHRRTMMQRLHLFPDDELPDDIRANLTEELPQPREIPRKLSEYTQEEMDAFPRLWTPLTESTLSSTCSAPALAATHSSSCSFRSMSLLIRTRGGTSPLVVFLVPTWRIPADYKMK